MEPAPTAPSNTCQTQWPNEEATQATAVALAHVLQLPTYRNLIILLHGSLGAGKTTFTRHLLHALGISGHIKSPTYAIVEAYEGVAQNPIWHFDFYRFNDPYEWEDAGFRDIFSATGLKIVEWPQQAGDLLPQADLEFFITHQQNTRSVKIQSNTMLGKEILSKLPL